MTLRWTAAGMLEAHIRRVVAIDEDLTALATAPRAWLRMSDVGSVTMDRAEPSSAERFETAYGWERLMPR
jgi:hypothetical protein